MHYYFAQTNTGYGCDAFGETAYGECATTAAPATPATPATSLSNTGTYLVGSTVLAVLLIAAAVVLFMRRKKSGK